MRSTTGAYYISLDHLRALAALLVFEWHFFHGVTLPEYVPSFFPAAIIDEGHCGVSLFMCLSGYLFAKLLDGKQINYFGFLWNRFIRLAPLLFFVILIVGFLDFRHDLTAYLKLILNGAIRPTLPNGGWSITVEAHFYLLLPYVLLLLRRHVAYVGLIVVAAILLRTGMYLYRGGIQTLAYFTIIGRVDQFVIGIVAFSIRDRIAKQHILMFALFIVFGAFYWYFDNMGGFYNSPSYPSPYRIWIVLPTIEALFFSLLIAYYDSSFHPRSDGLSRIIAKIGTYSYSIYLTHVFFVFEMGHTFFEVFQTRNFYFAILAGLVCFLVAAVLASFTYHFIEIPFLKLRRKYAKQIGKPENANDLSKEEEKVGHDQAKTDPGFNEFAIVQHARHLKSSGFRRTESRVG
jgi:peptidoglycan/LPS O-acetylase OafA/YrhL